MAPKKLVVTPGQQFPARVLSTSLLATDTEKHATSKSLYGDHKARISSNVSSIYDRLRLNNYKKLLPALAGKKVLHLGCGMGLVSMMFARAAATHVVAVDSSAIVDCARVVAQQNNLTNITFLRGDLKHLAAAAGLGDSPLPPAAKATAADDNATGTEAPTKLPFGGFDFIVCEWMGAFLTNEEDFFNILFCKKHLLASGGVVVPNTASVQVVGITDYRYRTETVDYWDNVYGFSMRPMQSLVLEEASTCAIPKTSLVTDSAKAYTVDVMSHPFETTTIENSDTNKAAGGQSTLVTLAPASNNFTAPFRLVAQRKATIHFLSFYVDATFASPAVPKDCCFAFNTTPGMGGNAWTEVSVALETPIPVVQGEVISGSFTVKPLHKVTEVSVVAKCEGSVAVIDTKGTYFYTY